MSFEKILKSFWSSVISVATLICSEKARSSIDSSFDVSKELRAPSELTS